MNVLTSLKTFLAKEETAPLWASRFLEIAKDWAGSTAFICEPTNPKPWAFSLTLAWGRHYSSAFFIPGRSQQLETISTTQSPLEWFNPAALKLFTLPCLAFPGYGSTLSLFLTHIDTFPYSCHGIHLVSSICEYNKLCFSWVFSVLFLGLYLTDNYGEEHRTRCALLSWQVCAELCDYQGPQTNTISDRSRAPDTAWYAYEAYYLTDAWRLIRNIMCSAVYVTVSPSYGIIDYTRLSRETRVKLQAPLLPKSLAILFPTLVLSQSRSLSFVRPIPVLSIECFCFFF